MKKDLTVERLKELLHYEPETGVFTWRVKTNKSRNWVGKRAGCANVSTGYVMIGIDGHDIRAHRLAWFYMTGEWPANEVDHRNTDKGDNRWDNLRQATTRLNGENKRRANRNSKTGFLGVSPHRNRFMARIKVNGKHKCLGTFDTPEQAHAAYVATKRQLHEGCTL